MGLININNSSPVYWVRGNTQSLVIPLEQEVIENNGEVQVLPYYPDQDAIVTVRLVGKYRKFAYNASVDGNLLRVTENGTIPAGAYGVEILIDNPDGTQLRSMWGNQVVVTNQNDSVLRQWDEFRQLDVTARAALFFFAKGDKGDKGDKVDAGTTDYNELENKPDLSIYLQEVSQEQFNEIFTN